MIRKIPLSCPECLEDIEMEPFDGRCKCWFCGRELEAVHDCGWGSPDEDGDYYCSDHAELVDE